MRDLRAYDNHRVTGMGIPKVTDPENEGMFMFNSPWDKGELIVIAAVGYGWDHISVSRADGTPSWLEMDYVKRLFFHEHEWAYQLHAPVAEHISGKWPGRRALNTLHVWKPHNRTIPIPPRWMVGANSATEWALLDKKADQAIASQGDVTLDVATPGDGPTEAAATKD